MSCTVWAKVAQPPFHALFGLDFAPQIVWQACSSSDKLLSLHNATSLYVIYSLVDVTSVLVILRKEASLKTADSLPKTSC